MKKKQLHKILEVGREGINMFYIHDRSSFYIHVKNNIENVFLDVVSNTDKRSIYDFSYIVQF